MKKTKLFILMGLFLFIPMVGLAKLSQPKMATLITDDGVKKVVVVGSQESNFYTGKLDYHLMTNLLGGTGVIYQTPALFETSLSSAIGKSDTSMTLVTGVDKSGTA